ncbi:Hypothetical predicted protein [Paramuricea clavata]|uniref:Uncharacterized protein n=1 Tax=Paramuricea clavata TaxID=317549 RepID=A0A6S7GI48_PARCT|nr:Hypothetical predicted protein [Paramuricea clavata]
MSSDDLLAKFDEIVKRFRCAFHEIIERAKMKAEVDGRKYAAQEISNSKTDDGEDIVETAVSCDGKWQRRGIINLAHLQRDKMSRDDLLPKFDELVKRFSGSVAMETAHMKIINLAHLQRDKMSRDDLLPKFDELVKRFTYEFHEIIERAKMKAEIDVYNAEKQRLQTVNATSTGRWEDALIRDYDSVVFNDFNPRYFVVILDYLRAKKIATAENPAALPKVSADQVKNFNVLLEYLGWVDETVLQKKLMKLFCKNSVRESEGITLQEGGKVAINDPNSGHRYVLGKNVYQKGIVRLKLNMESFQNNLGTSKYSYEGLVHMHGY